MTEKLDTGTDDLLARIEGDVAVLSFNRPGSRNALSSPMYEAFAAVLPVLAARSDVRVVMVTGEGGAFCAGGDVKGFDEANRARSAGGDSSAHPPVSIEARVNGLRRWQRAVTLEMFNYPKPVVAAVPGAAAGAGLSIALAADIRIAASNALFVTAFSTIGASGDFGGSWLLTQLVGPAKAKELYWTSPRLTADDALKLGIVNQVLDADGFADAALAWCHQLAARAPIAMQLAKENINRAITCDLATALDAEASNMVRSMQTLDHIEASAAFVEKRQPTFTGT